MKKIALLTILLLLNAGSLLLAQSVLLHNDRVTARDNPTSINPDWAPFYHGVASGDPLEDRVIIWTRVTPEAMNGEPIEVSWRVATGLSFDNIVQSGTFTTDADRDYTVKVDVSGLEANTTYYYYFTAMDKNSLIGKTKTTPTGSQASHLKFGVVSCSNFQAGYFNAYKGLANRTDLDAIIHLGDYIYEYASGVYGDSALFDDRQLEPANEIVTLEEYRARYSTYRLDTALARAHQQHPFITVWDDHESANDAYTDGAQNHDPATEGEWETRKMVAKQAYFEWMPIRENSEQSVYRTIRYGDLMDLVLLDTRLEGREEQINDITDPNLSSPDRTLLGAEQKAWLLDQLSNSNAQWKVIGQQVIFSEFNVGWAALIDPNSTFEGLESLFLDIWDGYPAERAQLIGFIEENEIDNIVILTGDFHSTFAFDVTGAPVDLQFQDLPGLGTLPFYNPSPTYEPTTGAGSVAVEFATPSITSANFDENTDAQTAVGLQLQINNPINVGVSLGNPNPHMKYNDLIQHGYFVLDVKPDSVQANWFYNDIASITEEETAGGAWFTRNSENHLQAASASSGPKAQQDQPAPNDPPQTANAVGEAPTNDAFAILGVYPNPFREINTLHYSLAKRAQVNVALYDTAGQLTRQLLNKELQAGIYSLQLNAEGLEAGTYFYRITVGSKRYSAKVVVK